MQSGVTHLVLCVEISASLDQELSDFGVPGIHGPVQCRMAIVILYTDKCADKSTGIISIHIRQFVVAYSPCFFYIWRHSGTLKIRRPEIGAEVVIEVGMANQDFSHVQPAATGSHVQRCNIMPLAGMEAGPFPEKQLDDFCMPKGNSDMKWCNVIVIYGVNIGTCSKQSLDDIN